MVMFMGEYRHNLDAKNRVIIPAKFRDGLGEDFVVTKGLDGCLSVYTMEKWEEILGKLSKIPATMKDARKYIRELSSKALITSLDNQGRAQLTQYLLNTADITKAVVIIGVADHIEIWSEERWDSYDEEAAESFEAVAESLTAYLADE